MHYIGMDCHITTLNFAVVNDAGRLVKFYKVPLTLSVDKNREWDGLKSRIDTIVSLCLVKINKFGSYSYKNLKHYQSSVNTIALQDGPLMWLQNKYIPLNSYISFTEEVKTQKQKYNAVKT